MSNGSFIKPQQSLDWRRLVGGLAGLIWRLVRIRAVAITLGILFVAYVVPSCLTTYVPPNMVGVRQVVYGAGAGIRRDVWGPGLHLMLPSAERVHLFPHDLQLVNFSDSSSEASQKSRTAPSIKIQTSDGYNVQLDVSVMYHIADAYRVFTEAGPGRAFEDRLVIPRADRILRKTLGELNSEEFYQGPRRIEKATAAHEALEAELSPFGIGVDTVLVRRYVYDERYQQLIEGRKIKDQTVFLRQAEAKSAIEERKRDTIVAEGKAQSAIELERGRAEVQKLNAQADLYRRKKAAEGKLMVELADARGTQLENAALEGAGSENMVGLKMADVLKGVKVLVLSSDGVNGLNPLDLASMLRKFEVR
jgi:regulator of protease activity HflC (stomatin/prohibitin superfamily)